MKKFITLALLAATTVSVGLPAQAASIQQHKNNQVLQQPVQTQAKRGATQSRRHAVGERIQHRQVTNVQNWRARGWQQPGRGQKYVEIDGRSYLVAATTLAILAAIN